MNKDLLNWNLSKREYRGRLWCIIQNDYTITVSFYLLRRVKTTASAGGVCSGGVDSPPEPADVSAMLKQVHFHKLCCPGKQDLGA
ncbi:hypothetical protein [Sporomusa sp. KB1]|uniref:hypothetical protein n=1 Tax=Sporomusa sp. KB1 TaxID=943346 RepID=UPI001C96FA79|nr:hypothetical protein [Sporomusa sp. KB1]